VLKDPPQVPHLLDTAMPEDFDEILTEKMEYKQ
jgi:hypothetical protein